MPSISKRFSQWEAIKFKKMVKTALAFVLFPLTLAAIGFFGGRIVEQHQTRMELLQFQRQATEIINERNAKTNQLGINVLDGLEEGEVATLREAAFRNRD